MSGAVEHAAEWVYRGVWGILASWFNVPKDPPTLPAGVRTFKPSRRYLAYWKFYFWLGLTVIDVALTIGWLALVIVHPLVGWILFPVYLVIAIVPDIVAYVAIHLRYDSTWYVLSDRSMRIRRGIWIIHETTITYENIQNVEVHQGPIERYFGVATLSVHTAGGGAGAGGKGGAHAGVMSAHVGVIEGITNAHELRDELMTYVERSRAAGLGDERADRSIKVRDGVVLGPEHLGVLAEIRSLVRSRAAGAS